jgi:phosphoglycolate phosphatase-like HAD superfamily hydrolase
MRNKITTLIFDFDGVIANTDLGRYNLLKKILCEFDVELSNSIKRKDLIGLSTKAFLVKFSKKLNQYEIDKIIKKRHDLFFSNLDKYCIPYDHVKDSILHLHSKYDLAIVTTNSIENVIVQLKHLGIYKLFKWIVGRELCETKELKKTYSEIPNALNKKVYECIVIEDSDFGVNAAKKEGYFCFRFDPENTFGKGSEDDRIESYVELVKKLG